MTTATIAGTAVTTTKGALVSALKAVSFAVPARPMAPMLANVRVSVRDDGRVTVTATDFDTSATATVAGAQDAGAGEFLAPLARLLKTLDAATKGTPKRAADSVPVTLADDGDGVVRVTVGGYGVPFADVPDVKDFPTVPDAPDATHSLALADLRSMVDRVGVTVGKDPLFPVFTHLHATLADDRVTLAATDRYRMARGSLAATSTGDAGGTANIPHTALAATLKAAAGDTVGLVVWGDLRERVTLVADNLTVTLRTYTDGEYPRIHRLFDDALNGSNRVTADRADLVKAVTRAGAIAALGEDKMAPVTIAATDDGDVTVTPDGVTAPAVPAITTGGLADARLNSTYLSAALAALPGDNVTLSYTASGKPLALRDSAEDDYVHVIMQLRKPTA